MFIGLTRGINGIPHFLPNNCHENYWDPPISSLTGFWDSPILTRGLWDSPCPSPPSLEGSLLRILASHPFGYRVSFPLWNSESVFTDLTSVVPRGLPFFFVFLSPRNSRPTSCSEELSNFFELTRSIIDQDAQPSPGTGLLENSKDTQFTQRKKGISRRQKRNLFPPSPRCTRKLSNDATVDLLSNCDDTDGD